MCLVILVSVTCCAQSSPFAASVVNSEAWAGDGLYNDPAASVVGKPSTWIYDPGYDDPVYGYPASTTASSVVNSPFNTDPAGNKLITALGDQDELVVAFDHFVMDDSSNLYGMDFTVFAAYAFTGDGWITESTDMDTYSIADGSLSTWDNFEMTVSISPDLVNWYTYATTINNDNLMPAQAFAWNNNQWGAEQDWTKPLDPSLTHADFAGATVAEALELYAGSAGGMSFDLAGSGFSAIKYIKLTGPGKIDGFADVAAVPEPCSILLIGLGAILMRRK